MAYPAYTSSTASGGGYPGINMGGNANNMYGYLQPQLRPDQMPGYVAPTGGTAGTAGTAGATGAPPAMTKDAAQQAAIARLSATGSGQNMPVTDATKAGLVSRQSDMSAAAEAQQNAALRRTTAGGGGSLYDPSHGAAERETASDRQIANQQAVREIDLGAQQQNWEAQFAANRLLSGMSDGSYNSRYDQSGPSTTKGADRVQAYSGPLSTAPSSLGTTNTDPRSAGLTTPTAGVQPTAQPTTSGIPSNVNMTYEQYQQELARQEESRIQALVASASPAKQTLYRQALNRGMPQEKALQYAGIY